MMGAPSSTCITRRSASVLWVPAGRPLSHNPVRVRQLQMHTPQRARPRPPIIHAAASSEPSRQSQPPLSLVRSISTGDLSARATAWRTSSVGHPAGIWFRIWWAFTIGAAAFTGLFTPWQVAFTTDPMSLYSLDNAAAWVEMGLLAVFGADIALRCTVKLQDEDGALVESDDVAHAYMSSRRFWWDVLGAVPFDFIAVAALGTAGMLNADTGTMMAAEGGWGVDRTLALCSLLRLLHLVRLYRVRWLFNYLEYNVTLSLLWVMVLRNVLIMLFLTHWSACAFFDVARFAQFQPDMLIGADAQFFAGLPLAQQYLYSIFWALSTLSSAEFNSDAPGTVTATVSATFRALLFMAFNIALGAYVVGTTTLLVVKSDERTGRYRERSQNLKDFVAQNELPEDLKESMQEHLRLHFESEQLSNESVLSIYPSTIRRRILRHLYLSYLQQSYLFAGCSQKHLDALLGAARLEVFLPQVDILAAGEMVNELCIVVGGVVEVVPIQMDGCEDGILGAEVRGVVPIDKTGTDMPSGVDGAGAVVQEDDARPVRLVGEGELFGEVAFFTETAQLEAIRSLTVTRVLIITRAAFDSIERNFPIASRKVLENLRLKAEKAVSGELGRVPEQLYVRLLAAMSSPLHPASRASAELMDGPEGAPGPLSLLAVKSMPQGSAPLSVQQEEDVQRIIQDMTPRQEQALANLVRIQALVTEHISKLEEEATIQFLYAASRGSTTKVRQMLSQGFDVNRADYDNRTALMLACVKGHYSTVKMLLEAGARPNIVDNFGSSALLEACTYGHDSLIDLLLQYGARLGTSSVEDASLLCTCVYEGNMPKLRRLLKAGLPVDSFDYDRRTAAHISAAEGNITALRLLVEEGGANLGILDRWGHSVLDEAQRIGAANVVQYLVVRMSHDEDQHTIPSHPLKIAAAKSADIPAANRNNIMPRRSWTIDDDEEPWYNVPKGHASRLFREVENKAEGKEKEEEQDGIDMDKVKRPDLSRDKRRFNPPTGPRYAHPPGNSAGGGDGGGSSRPVGKRLQRHRSAGRRGGLARQQGSQK